MDEPTPEPTLSDRARAFAESVAVYEGWALSAISLLTAQRDRAETGREEANLRLANAEDLVGSLTRQGEVVTRERDDALAERAAARQEVARLLAEIDRLKNPPEPEPEEKGPGVTVLLSWNQGEFLDEWTPGGPGERQGDERRWEERINEHGMTEVFAILDVWDDGKVQLALGRPWTNIPYGPPLEPRVHVTLNGTAVLDEVIRIHPHNFATEILRQGSSGPPKVDLVAAGVVPDYDPSGRLLDADLVKMAAGTGKYPRWAEPHNRLGERRGVVTGGWTGGFAWGNEAAFLPPWAVEYLHSQDPRAWDLTVEMGLSSGCYPVHFWDRATGKPSRPDSPAAAQIPKLVGDGLPAQFTAIGDNIPPGDVAHGHSLAGAWALLGGGRLACELHEGWTLLPCWTKTGAERAVARIDSGQTRATACAINHLQQLVHLLQTAAPTSPEAFAVAQYYSAMLDRNLQHLTDYYATPGGGGFRPNGVIEVKPLRTSAMLAMADPAAKEMTHTWNFYALAHSLHMCGQAGYEVGTLLDHVLLAAEGAWTGSDPSHADAGAWQHALPPGVENPGWPAIVATTFKRRTTQPAALQGPLTPEMLGMACGAWWAARDRGRWWGTEAVRWAMEVVWKWKGGPPATWRFR